MSKELTEDQLRIVEQKWNEIKKNKKPSNNPDEMDYNEFHEFCMLCHSVRTGEPYKKTPTKYNLPELKKFIKKNLKKDRSYCERYLVINGQKVSERLPLEKTLPDGSYRNGVVLKKETNRIIFITYTTLDGKCVMNHESVHDLNGSILDLTVNAFYAGLISGVDKDGQDYLKELIKVMNQNDFAWDVIE